MSLVLRASFAVLAVAGVLFGAVPSEARTRQQLLADKDTYDLADAQKGQSYINAAMTTPMIDMLRRADVTRPEVMLQYGLALELGREPATAELSASERSNIKAAYRAMLNLYLTSADDFDVTFNEDTMLDQPEFWIDLAKHIGRREDSQNAALPATAAGGGMVFLNDQINPTTRRLNLNQNTVLKRPVVNAATGCAASAAAFAKMKKAQTVDLSLSKLPAETWPALRAEAADIYRTAWQVGLQACGGEAYFTTVADFAADHLGEFGAMIDDPAAVPVSLTTE